MQARELSNLLSLAVSCRQLLSCGEHARPIWARVLMQHLANERMALTGVHWVISSKKLCHMLTHIFDCALLRSCGFKAQVLPRLILLLCTHSICM